MSFPCPFFFAPAQGDLGLGGGDNLQRELSRLGAELNDLSEVPTQADRQGQRRKTPPAGGRTDPGQARFTPRREVELDLYAVLRLLTAGNE